MIAPGLLFNQFGRFFVALLVCCFVVACGTEPDSQSSDDSSNNDVSDENNDTQDENNDTQDENNDTQDDSDGPAATFVTYNVGLARGYVDFSAERAQPVADAVAALDADVVCLQEVWLYQNEEGEWVEDDIQRFISAAAESFPHSYYHITEDESEAVGCTEEEATPLAACVQQHCDEVGAGELAGCALQNCGTEFQSTSQECQQCIAANLGSPLEEILETCLSDEGAGGTSANGHNGLLVLSKHEILAENHVAFPAVLVNRSALHVRVNIPEVGEADAFCTHLAADLSDSIDYPGAEFDSFGDEQAEQIRRLIEWADETSTSSRQVLLGDFNTGPAVNGIEAELAANYELFTSAGYSAPYVEDAPACTFCSENTLNSADTEDRIIDHVFLKFTDAYSVESAVRIMDETYTIEAGLGGLETHLSDHFGVQVTITQ